MRKLLQIVPAIVVFIAIFVIVQRTGNTIRTPEHSEGTMEEREGRTGAMAALDFWTRSRAYPDADIPADKYYRAYTSAKRSQKEISLGATTSTIWDPIGPINLAGRSISVALNPLNPNTIYLGTASGGLWKSLTGGLGGDWVQVKLGYPALGISAIVIDPTDTNTIYLGTGEVYRYTGSLGGLVVRTTRGSYGIGILKTTNGGSTWTKSLDWTYQQQTGIQAIKMDPTNHNVLWAATTDGIMKTTDGGANWETPLLTQMGEDIIIKSDDPNSIIVSIGNLGVPPSGLYKSTDGGANWAGPLGIGTYTGKIILDMYAAHPNVIYASAADSTIGNGDLWKSTDFGDNWSLVHHHPSGDNLFQVQGWYSHFVVVHPTDSSKIIHAGVPIFKSTNSGGTFFVSSGVYSDNHAYALNPQNPDIIYVADDDGIYRSTNFGTSFVSVGYGLQTGQFYNGFSCSSQDSLLAAGQSQDHLSGYVYHGSTAWSGGVVDESGWTATDPTDDTRGYAVSRWGQSICRLNFRFGGGSCIGMSGSGAWNSPIAVAPSNPNVLYFGDVDVYKSTDFGNSFGRLFMGNYSNPSLCMAIAPTSADTVFVGKAPIGAAAQVFRSTNGGSSWTNVTTGLPNRYPLDLAVDPHNSSVVYAAMGGFGGGHLFKSTDAGSTWTDKSGTLPDMPTGAVAIDPLHSNNVYVGNDFGVSVSTDGGSTWSAFNAGLPDAVIVADLVVSPSNRALRVVTHGNGVWERKLYGEFADVFDYRPFAFVLPADGSHLTAGTGLSSFTASVRNAGTVSPADSFFVKYRILFGNTEVFASTKKIGPIGSGDTRQVTFTGAFTATQRGTYTLELISLAADQNSGNDTLTGVLESVGSPTLGYSSVTKQHCTYSEISGGTPGPTGDDIEAAASIPFVFTYNGANYDSVLISTNGWLELGTGPDGSFNGLSTMTQVGQYFSQQLGTENRPTKTLGPWWSDLYTDNSQISYQTQGVAPDRVFVVQWKNMAQCCQSNSTRLNFQVRLHESTNIVEFDYGPITPGVFDGSGAAMGFKDNLGGDYRYYDLSTRSTGLSADLRTSLYPSVDWPGADSCFQINTDVSGVSLSLSDRWNLVSVPVGLADNSITSVFPGAAGGSGFAYNGSYVRVDSLQPGKGCWIRLAAPAVRFLTGGPMANVSVSLDAGWNLIGSVDHSVPAPSGGTITSRCFGYNTSYFVSGTVEPGRAYWVKSGSAGKILLGGPVVSKDLPDESKTSDHVTITDRLGRSQTLAVAGNPRGINLDLYEVPPVPPAGMFDIRYASNRTLETYSRSSTVDQTFDILMQSAEPPLTLSFTPASGGEGIGVWVDVMHRQEIVSSTSLTSGGGNANLTPGAGNTLRLRIATTGGTIPKTFALAQNFPNPFNPATKISFDLPVRSAVRLVVYDILGRQVMRLADGELEAGTHTVTADFSSQASGVYLYKLTAGSFSQVRKLVVTR